MKNPEIDHILLFLAAWWVFAALASFAAATLFWNRGAAELTGKEPGVKNMALKLKGASAIWAVSLLVFGYVNPVRQFKTLLQGVTAGKPASTSGSPVVISSQAWKDLDLESQGTKVELIPWDLAGNRAIRTQRQIPPGLYQMRVTHSGSTGHDSTTETRVIDVASPEEKSK